MPDLLTSKASGQGARARSSAPDARILVVDDIKTNQLAAICHLDKYECKVDACASGAGAVNLVQQRAYDMVFMDYMMPNMSGARAVREIRAIGGGAFQGLPIVALTANTIWGAREMLLSEGFSDYLSKPIEARELDGIMRKWLPSEKLLRRAAPGEASSGEPARGIAQGGPGSGALASGALSIGALMADSLLADGIDIRAGLARHGERAHIDALRSYFAQTPKLLEKLRRAGAREERLVALCGLKGSSFGICADAIGKQAEALARAAEGCGARLAEADCAPLAAAAERALEGLGAFLAAIERKPAAKPAPKPMASEPSAALLRELASASKKYNVSAMEGILDKLEAYRYKRSGNFLVRWLREQSCNLEYKAIWTRLEAV
jgi:CheY-like chemotaxis protein